MASKKTATPTTIIIQDESVDPSAPAWYQYQNWWDGEKKEDVIARLSLHCQDHGIMEGTWLVVPGWFVDLLLERDLVYSVTESNATVERSIDNLIIRGMAEDIFMELIRTTKTTAEPYADKAWSAAESFFRRGATGFTVVSAKDSNE